MGSLISVFFFLERVTCLRSHSKKSQVLKLKPLYKTKALAFKYLLAVSATAPQLLLKNNKILKEKV